MIAASSIAGGSLLLLASAGYGYLKIREGRQSLRETEALHALVTQIRSRIARYNMPLSEIMPACREEYLEKNGFLHRIQKSSFRQAWDETPWHVPSAVRESMESFSIQLGGGYREEELQRCDEVLETLGACLRTLREDIKGREKLYRTLPPLLALSVLLLFL